MATSEGQSVSGGKLSSNITKIFKSNKKLLEKNYMNFGEICKLTTDNIQRETNKKQALIMEETDIHINAIILKPSDNKRGYGGEDEDAQEADYTEVYLMLGDLEDELGGEDQVRIYQSELNEYNYEYLQQIIDDPDDILESVIKDYDHRSIIINKAQSMIE
eukprot:316600_1